MPKKTSPLSPDTVDALLHFDPLSTAEKLTGESYKADGATEALGMLLMMNASQAKRETLITLQDTHWGMSFNWLKNVCDDLGLKLVFEEPIPDTKDTFFVFASPEGLIVSGDTYWDKVNSVHLHGCWVPPDIKNMAQEDWDALFYCSHEALMNCTHSVSFKADGREGLKRRVQKMRSRGKFDPKWGGRPMTMFHLVDYAEWRAVGERRRKGDYKDLHKDIDEAHARRIKLLPQWVQEMIG